MAEQRNSTFHTNFIHLTYLCLETLPVAHYGSHAVPASENLNSHPPCKVLFSCLGMPMLQDDTITQRVSRGLHFSTLYFASYLPSKLEGDEKAETMMIATVKWQ